MEYITMSEAAKRANVSTKTIQRAIEKGALEEAPRLQDNQARIAIDQFERWLVSRQPVQPVASAVDPTITSRLAELEQTVQGLHNDQLLGAGRDLLALGPADDAYTQNRIDALEKRLADLEALHLKTQEALAREQQETEGLRRQIDTLEERIRGVEIDTMSSEEIARDVDRWMAKPGLQHLVEREKAKLKEQTSVPAPQVVGAEEEKVTEPTYEGEWTITDAGGQVVYHDPDPQRARRRLDSLITNYRDRKWELHWPVFTPSSGTATEITTNLPNKVYKRLVLSTGEVIDFYQDFIVPGLHGYICKATHKDVKAELTVYPYQHNGDYSLTQTKWGKISDVGREGPKQTRRAQYLLATLIDRTEQEMRKVGWVESGTRDDITPHRPLWRKANV